jgi:hypothetical protein
LIRNDGRLAGLAFVKRGSEFSGVKTVWDLAEFFVLQGLEWEPALLMKCGDLFQGAGRFG